MCREPTLRLADFRLGLSAYYLTTLIVVLGVLFGCDFVVPPKGIDRPTGGVLAAMAGGDGENYRQIAVDGYEYDSQRSSIVAFFPGYPWLARFVIWLTGVSPLVSLIIVSQVALAASFVVLAAYARTSGQQAGSAFESWVVLAFGFWPPTFFLRMAYGEALFFFTTVLTMLGARRGWPVWGLALLAGVATAIRPVGIVLAAAVCWLCLRQPAPMLVRLGRVAPLAALSCWGLLAYMAYLYHAFDQPLAFALTQKYHTFQTHPDVGLSEKLWAWLSLEPIRGVYDPHSPRYWAILDAHNNPAFSLLFWNPIVFALALAAIVVGAQRRWLTGFEGILGVGLLAVPLATRGYEMSMASHARFTTVVVPIYLVIGRLLEHLPPAVACGICGLAAFILGVWSSLFAAGHFFF